MPGPGDGQLRLGVLEAPLLQLEELLGAKGPVKGFFRPVGHVGQGLAETVLGLKKGVLRLQQLEADGGTGDRLLLPERELGLQKLVAGQVNFG